MSDDSRASRFTLSDGMALVTAAAIGVYLARSHVLRNASGHWVGEAVHYGGFWFAAALSVAIFLLNARPRTWDRDRLASSPGFGASCCVLGAFLACFFYAGVGLLVRPSMRMGQRIDYYFLDTAFSVLSLGIPFGVASNWAWLWILGRWRPRKSALEMLGILLGLYWASWPLLTLFVSSLAEAAREH
jgi:hypothetical protein